MITARGMIRFLISKTLSMSGGLDFVVIYSVEGQRWSLKLSSTPSIVY